MKLKDGFVTQNVGDTQFLVSVGGEGFGGFVRSNPSAAYIVELLSAGIDKKGIVDAMCARYDAPRDVIAADVEEILAILRRIGALDEKD